MDALESLDRVGVSIGRARRMLESLDHLGVSIGRARRALESLDHLGVSIGHARHTLESLDLVVLDRWIGSRSSVRCSRARGSRPWTRPGRFTSEN